MSFSRRQFLSLIGVGALVSVLSPLPKFIKAGPPVIDGIFNPYSEYGRAILTYCLDEGDNSIIRWLHQDAKRVLPHGTPYDLRVERLGKSQFKMAWLYQPKFMGRKRGLYGTRLEGESFDNWTFLGHDEPYVSPQGIRQDSWGEYQPGLGIWMRGMFYA